MEELRAPAADRLVVGDSDPVTAADLRALAESPTGPKVSIMLPTHRKGADVRQDPVQLRNLLDDAAHRLIDQGVDPATVLTPARALLDDHRFWQHQCDGLAVFASPDVSRWFRVPFELPASLTVGDTFHVAPLAPMLSGDGEFLVLAVSQNSVRLFVATRSTIGELDPGPIPTSMAEALAHEDPERQLQARSVGAGDTRFHGHGVGEHDKAAVERFLRAVDHGLHDLVGADPRPLVLACVGYYVPIFRSVTRHADVVEPAVEGNPEHLKPAELHAAAWERISDRLAAELEKSWARYDDGLGNGHATETLGASCARAEEGRVDTLFVGDGPVDDTDDAQRVLDRAVLATLASSGNVVSVNASRLPAGEAAVALLRY
jgi:hypothetical protein